MVTGRDASGRLVNSGQQITRMEALRIYTMGGAWHTFDDEETGSIEVGKLADLAVLSDEYLTVPDEEIRTLTSVLTLVGGGNCPLGGRVRFLEARQGQEPPAP